MRRAKPGRPRTGRWIAIAAIGGAVLITGYTLLGQPPSTPRPGSLLGVFGRGMPGSYTPVETFAKTIGTSPNVALYYVAWGRPFDTAFAQQAHSHQATPLVQMEPFNISLRTIAAGGYDGYLRSFAAEVRSYRNTVILSFTHEMNGNWYSWGRDPPVPGGLCSCVATRRKGLCGGKARPMSSGCGPSAVAYHGPGDLNDYWPGDAYVDWVGIDGYYMTADDTFQDVFMPTINEVRKLTGEPILLPRQW